MLSGITLAMFLCVVCMSAAIQATLGFAFSIFGMVFLPGLFPAYSQAVAVSSVLSCLTSMTVAAKELRNIRWRVLLPCVIGYFLTSPVAISMSAQLEKALLTRMLGGFLTLLGLYFIFLGGKVRIRPTVRNGFIAGTLSGVGGGLFAVGGPPLVVFFLSSLDKKEEYSATIQMCIVCTGLYAAAIRIINGIFTYELVMTTAAGAVAMFAGAMIGYRIMKRAPIDKLKKVIYLVMIFSGVKMLLGF